MRPPNCTLSYLGSTILILCSFFHSSLQAQLTVSKLFGDNMVLQRNQPIRIWGTATPESAVYLELHTQLSLAFADENGVWSAELGALSAGGPYSLQVRTETETLNFEEILIGEVWVCAGQSNMEWQIRQIPNADEESAAANWPNIRFFKTPKRLESNPKRDLESGSWQVCTPDNSRNFSAAAYFFSRNLHLNLDVPIGIIEITWGGTQINTWISQDGLSAFPDLQGEIATLQDLPLEDIQDSSEQLQEGWDQQVEYNDQGLGQQWWADNYQWDDWPKILLPKPWKAGLVTRQTGSIWLKKRFSLTKQQADQDMQLSLGQSNVIEKLWINGKPVDNQSLKDIGSPPTYTVDAELLRSGENVITCLVLHGDTGSPLYGGSNFFKSINGTSQKSIAGYWSYRRSVTDLGISTSSFNPNENPSLIFNGMVASIIGLRMAGVVWYQGESDTGDPFYYREKQVALIDDWRTQWDIGDFPFITTQLPHFRATNSQPGASSWATIRESQAYTLKRDNTALTTTIDTGDPFDIHPNNKFQVGTRLAQDARRLVYNDQAFKPDASYFMSTAAAEGEMVIYFRTHGSALSSTTPDDIPGFTIAGADGDFIWANARLLNNHSVAVSHPSITQPRYVRYAWADNPGPLKLFNTLGRPVRPFRTDELPTPYE